MSAANAAHIKLVEKCLAGEAITVTIHRGMKDGKSFLHMTPALDYSLSRKLTGTTGEEGNGVFASETPCTFLYGDREKSFKFAPLNFHADISTKIQTELCRRIEEVKQWVESIDYEETFEFKI